MSWQTLFVQNPCSLSIKNANILLKRREQDNISMAISEISVIIIEHKEVIITSAILSKCAENNILLISCNDKYMPAGLFQPISMHSRFTKHLLSQIGWSEAFKGRAWQLIVKAKIENQSALIKKLGAKEHLELKTLVKLVDSKDKQNVEARASKVYWAALFDDFARGYKDDVRNSALNYGYAIIRSVISRNIVATGFTGALGLHHKSELNPFNLADDLIEVFRPFVDERVHKLFSGETRAEGSELTREDKKALIDLLNHKVMLEGQKNTILVAINKVCTSLLQATNEKNAKLLIVPKL